MATKFLESLFGVCRAMFRYVRDNTARFLVRVMEWAHVALFASIIVFSIYGIYAFRVNYRLKSHLPFLVQAAYNNNVEDIRALLAIGVDPNLRDLKGNTALDVALFRGSDEAARVLLDAGAEEGLSRWRQDMRWYVKPLLTQGSGSSGENPITVSMQTYPLLTSP